MTGRSLEEMSKEELLRELQKLETADRRFAATAGEADRERLIHELHVHQVELEMQNRELREAQERLEQATSRYSDLYDFAPVGYCTLDPEGRLKELNLTAAALLGVLRDTVVGSPFASVAPLKDRRLFLAHLSRCQRESGRVTSELTFGVGKRDARSVQIISDPVRDPSGATTGYRTILVDISDLKVLESRLRLLSTAGETLTSSLESSAACDAAARIAVPALSDLCIIDLASDSGTAERRVVRFADPQKQATLAERLMQFTPRPGWQTPQARVIASGEPMLLSKVAPRDDHDADPLGAADVRSLMVVPLKAGGRTLGALTLASAESERRYSSADLEVAEDLSSRIAMALENARLYGDSGRANELLRLAEAKSTGIVSISADAIISIDEGQRITLFNEGAEKIFGYSKAEAVGALLDILIPDRLRPIHRQHVERFAAGQEVSRRVGERGATIIGLRKNGEEFPADASISKLAVGGKTILTVALRDVTELKRLENDQRLLADLGAALAPTVEYEETLTTIAQFVVRALADFCVIDVIDDDGEVQRLRVVGRDPTREWVCKAMSQMGIDGSRPHPVWSVLETRQPSLIQTVTAEVLASWAQTDDHARVLRGLAPKSLIAVPLVARGTLIGVLKLVSSTRPQSYGEADVRLAEEIGRRAALAIENARLFSAAEGAIRARDEVLGVVAHDLRNPLGNIVLQAQLMRRRGVAPDRRSRKPAEVIERAATRMNRLIQDILDVTSVEGGRLSIEKASVDAGGVVSEFVRAQEPLTSSRSLDLQLTLAPDLGKVFADRERLLQALENLVGNAVKFTKPGGRITVGAAPKDGEVLFWVADTGAGIEAESLPHLFDRFWQGRKRDPQGTGLGLTIVKGIVEAHGGRVWVESQVGVGSTFFLTVPRVRPEPTEARASSKTPAARQPPRVVLVAEDDPLVQDALRETLEHAGYTVAMAANGAEALEYLHREARPLLVILDLAMPVMDGWAFLSERNRDPDLRSIPVIVVTGRSEVEQRVVASHASYVQKPIELDRLIQTMEHVVH